MEITEHNTRFSEYEDAMNKDPNKKFSLGQFEVSLKLDKTASKCVFKPDILQAFFGTKPIYETKYFTSNFKFTIEYLEDCTAEQIGTLIKKEIDNMKKICEQYKNEGE